MRNILFIILAVIFLQACEEKPVTIPEFQEIETGKVVLIEELTGVSCPNCPTGSKTVEAIADKYNDNIIVVGIHGDFLSEPITKEGYESKYDLRTDAGKFLEGYLAPWISKPCAYFNRVKKESDDFFGNSAGGGEWFSRAEEELNRDQVIGLNLTPEYDQDSRKLKLKVIVDPLVDLQGDYYVSVMITENNIIDSQKDADKIKTDYHHKHVLRDMITAYEGDPVGTSFSEDVNVELNFEYTLPESNGGIWKPKDVSAVVFISDLTGSSKEILQAAEVHIVQ